MLLLFCLFVFFQRDNWFISLCDIFSLLLPFNGVKNVKILVEFSSRICFFETLFWWIHQLKLLLNRFFRYSQQICIGGLSTLPLESFQHIFISYCSILNVYLSKVFIVNCYRDSNQVLLFGRKLQAWNLYIVDSTLRLSPVLSKAWTKAGYC